MDIRNYIFPYKFDHGVEEKCVNIAGFIVGKFIEVSRTVKNPLNPGFDLSFLDNKKDLGLLAERIGEILELLFYRKEIFIGTINPISIIINEDALRIDFQIDFLTYKANYCIGITAMPDYGVVSVELIDQDTNKPVEIDTGIPAKFNFVFSNYVESYLESSINRLYDLLNIVFKIYENNIDNDVRIAWEENNDLKNKIKELVIDFLSNKKYTVSYIERVFNSLNLLYMKVDLIDNRKRIYEFRETGKIYVKIFDPNNYYDKVHLDLEIKLEKGVYCV
jgi:hypothetical protein